MFRTLLLVVVFSALYLEANSCMWCAWMPCFPVTCKGGVVRDACNCCDECAKVEGESCGGRYIIEGYCDSGLTCHVSENSVDDYPVGKCLTQTSIDLLMKGKRETEIFV